MFYSASGLDSYNKTVRTAQGTLIQNWNEERTLREDLGEGRTVGKAHIQKKHEELFLKPVNELQDVYDQNAKRDETFGRVFGRKQEPNYLTEHRHKYNKKNPYQESTGKKYGLIEKQYLDVINQELKEANKNMDDLHNKRYMNTTYGNEFTKKNVGVNVVGRRVMKDQNGQSLPPDTRDEDLLVDHGFSKRNPLADEQDLQAAVKKESYVTAKPYTFWQEKINDGAFYNSKQTSDNAQFTKNNEFLKTFHNYTHIKN